MLCPVAQLCQTSKTRQKYDWKVREIDGSYLCLQQFDKCSIWSIRNDRKRKLFEYSQTQTCMKKIVKAFQVNLFLAGCSHLKPMCVVIWRDFHKGFCLFFFRTSTPPATANNSGVDSPDSEKCREIRDLHNSMERQRRVEQRNHLAYLKKQVPEVADMDKASKLTILRKAMDYCHLLSNMDSRIRKDQAKELSRNQMLKKKLLDLTQKHDARRVTGSGRHTGWSGSQRW